MLKLALNGVYGDSNNQYSPFYDPLYTMSVTITGQLLLCKLAENLMSIPGLQMVQINTDGLTVRIPRDHYGWFKKECTLWMTGTGLTLEQNVYSRMWVRDVNNYIAEYEDGKLKRKGAYEYNREWHQDHSALIVPKAAEAHLVRGESISDFIRGHSDIFDFMLRAKVDRSSRLMWGDVQVQNITRYYVTDQEHGGTLTKIMPPLAKNPGVERHIGQCVGWYVQPCNDIMEATAPINYDYYIQEAEKLCEPLR